MPLYEYQCDACGHRFEVIRKFSDAPLEGCPKCGGHVQKLASAPAIKFKGSGWYITDYPKKDAAAGGKSDGSSDAPSKSDGSKDASPAGADAASDKSKPTGKGGDKDKTAGSDASSSSSKDSSPSTSPAPTKE